MYFILLIINTKSDIQMKRKYIGFMKKMVTELISGVLNDQPKQKDSAISFIKSFIGKTTEETKRFPYRRLMTSLDKILANKDVSKTDLLEYLQLLDENFVLQQGLLDDIEKYKKSKVIFTEKMIEDLTQL